MGTVLCSVCGGAGVVPGDVVFDATETNIVLQMNGGMVEIWENGTMMFQEDPAMILSITINGNSLDNTLTVDFTNGNPITAGGLTYDGKLQGRDFDTLTITGGTVDSTTHRTLTEYSGEYDIVIGGLTYTIYYDNLEPIVDNGDAVDRFFEFGASDEWIHLNQGAIPATQTNIDSDVGESVDFTTPTNSLTIDMTDASFDVLTFQGMAGNFVATTSLITIDTSSNDMITTSQRVFVLPSLTITGGANLNFNVDGATQGLNYDQYDITGTVTLTSVDLNMILGYSPTVGDSYTIINNDAAEAVSGTFTGLPEGSCFTDGGELFQITYQGGDGNDVVVTAVELDYGDAPDSYSTVAASNGARHVVGSLYLGASVDADADGQPDATATGDDTDGNDDEDGVTFPGSMT